jgi:hypothetical protein
MALAATWDATAHKWSIDPGKFVLHDPVVQSLKWLRTTSRTR